MSYQESFVEVIETNLTKKPDSPQITIKNPLKKDIFVNSIQLSFDAYFSEKGVIIIKINNNIVLPQKPVGSYGKIQNLPIPLKNQEFLQQQKIEVYAWNGIDNDFVSVGVDIVISEDPDLQIGNDTPLSQIQRNKQISQQNEIFPFRDYYNEIVTQLIDMKGFPRFWAMMSAQNYTSPTIIENTGVYPSASAIVDGSLSTMSGEVTKTAIASGSFYIVVDFGSISSRIPKVKFKSVSNQGSGGTVTITTKLQLSNDNVLYVTKATDTRSNGTFDNLTMTATEQNFRYIKILVEFSMSILGSNFIKSAIYEIFDDKTLGGTASLSFELRDSLGNWHEIIPSSEFGTVTLGQSVVAQIGDTLTKKYAIPSSQTDFRAKLTIAGGGINTGVSIQKVA